MKLHDNSRFRGSGVVISSYAKLLKSHGLIEIAGGLVGLANLQKNSTFGPLLQGANEGFGGASTPRGGVDREVQQLAFPGGDGAGDEEACYGIVKYGDKQVVGQVVGDGPLRGFG